jgi:hypothetical protein
MANDNIQTWLKPYAMTNLNNPDTYLILAELTYNMIVYKLTQFSSFVIDLEYVLPILIHFVLGLG